MRFNFLLVPALFLTTVASPVSAQQPLVAPPSAASPAMTADADPQRAAEVDRRGDHGMGFSHSMTGHHFHLLADGGSIEVEANRSEDAASREAIRSHMAMIAGMFTEGNFSLPMFIHATVPPGVETLQRLKAEITYAAENTSRGAQVRILTKNPEALAAIHEFLRFQIKDHRTGDTLDVPPPATPTAARPTRPGDNLGRDARPGDLHE